MMKVKDRRLFRTIITIIITITITFTNLFEGDAIESKHIANRNLLFADHFHGPFVVPSLYWSAPPSPSRRRRRRRVPAFEVRHDGLLGICQ